MALPEINVMFGEAAAFPATKAMPSVARRCPDHDATYVKRPWEGLALVRSPPALPNRFDKALAVTGKPHFADATNPRKLS
jgi:hypothetical protein